MKTLTSILITSCLLVSLATPAVAARQRATRSRHAKGRSFLHQLYYQAVPAIIWQLIYGGPNPCLPIPQNTNPPAWCRR